MSLAGVKLPGEMIDDCLGRSPLDLKPLGDFIDNAHPTGMNGKRIHLPPAAHPWGPAGVRHTVKYAVSPYRLLSPTAPSLRGMCTHLFPHALAWIWNVFHTLTRLNTWSLANGEFQKAVTFRCGPSLEDENHHEEILKTFYSNLRPISSPLFTFCST